MIKKDFTNKGKKEPIAQDSTLKVITQKKQIQISKRKKTKPKKEILSDMTENRENQEQISKRQKKV